MFGIWLATHAALARAGLVLTAAITLVCGLLARGHSAMLGGRLALLVAMGIAWSAGISVALGGALLALQTDLEQGVIALARLRGVTRSAYVRGRVCGLFLMVALSVCGPCLSVAVVTMLEASDRLGAAREGIAAMAYCLAFAVTVAPLALAALGVGSRIAGYLGLVAFLALPEVVAPWTEHSLPAGWRELSSLPAAMAAVADGIHSGGASLGHMARASIGLGVVVVASLLVLEARLARAEARAQP